MENPLLKYLAFVKTVEEGSFTRAAQKLDYAQSSISKMVADLEQEWSMTLLERSKNGVRLTSAGEQILSFLRKVLQEQQALEGQIDRMNGRTDWIPALSASGPLPALRSTGCRIFLLRCKKTIPALSTRCC